MENQEQMTVRDVLEITARNLGEIAVPRSMNEQIGIPIDQAISNITACVNALDKAEADAVKKEEPTGEAAEEADEQTDAE